MTERLRRSGIRPVSILVDITQYVMLELGQPMHAYDAAKLNGAVEVRRARKDEKIKLLDGREYTLAPEYLVIADAKEAIGLAGIMGGFDSRVTDTTRDIFLEAAHFAPATIMGRARNLALAHRCVASFRARRRSGIAAHRDGTRDATRAVDRRRHAGAGRRNDDPKRLCQNVTRCRCVARVSRACSASRSAMRKSNASSPRST